MSADWQNAVRIKKDACVDLFTRHPHQAGESYCQHFAYAVGLGGKLAGLGCAAVVHGICPFWLATFVSDRLPGLGRSLERRGASRDRATSPVQPSPRVAQSVPSGMCRSKTCPGPLNAMDSS